MTIPASAVANRSRSSAEAWKESLRGYQPIVRLDQPAHPSTHLADRIAIHGWFIAPPGLTLIDRTLRPQLEVLLEEISDNPLRSQGVAVGHKLSRDLSATQAFLEYLQIDEESPLLDIDGTSPLAGEIYGISGSINVAALVPHEDEPTARYNLTLVLNLDSCMGVSNSVEFAIPPHRQWFKPYGGFIFPVPGRVATEFLVIDGWALSLGDSLKVVEVELNDIKIDRARTGIWSPRVNLALPAGDHSLHARFSLALSRSEMISHFGRKLDLEQPLTIRAVCRFASGEELRFEVPRVLWNAADAVGSGELCGQVERVCAGTQGRVRIEGWAFSRRFSEIRLFLEGATKRIELNNNADAGTVLQWIERPDRSATFLCWRRNVPMGFIAEFDPLLLGRLSGLVRVVAATNDGERAYLGEESWNKLYDAIEENFVYHNAIEHAAVKGVKVFSRLGLRKAFSGEGPAEQLNGNTSRLTHPSRKFRRFVFATHNLSTVEGAPKVLWSVISELRRRFAEAEILVISAAPGSYQSQLEREGIRVEVIPTLSMIGQSFDRYHRALSYTAKVIEAFNPEIVSANVIDSIWAVDIAKRLAIPAVWTIHESVNPFEIYPELDAELRTQLLHRLANAEQLVFVSEATKSLYSRLPSAKRAVVIPNGIDIDSIAHYLTLNDRRKSRETLGIEDDCFVVSIIGTTTYRKGQDIFVREMAALAKGKPERKFRFYVVGARNIPFLEELKLLVRRAGLEAVLSFVSETPEVGPYYLASDAVVVASREESAPLVSLEAFAYGVPLVSTQVFGLAEQIRDGENALAFAGDVEGDLAAKITILMADKKLRKKLTAQALEDVRNRFQLKDSTEKHLQILAKIGNA